MDAIEKAKDEFCLIGIKEVNPANPSERDLFQTRARIACSV
jgi:hypothetical protein